jgi:curved DNA-binding protein CbpA
VKIQLAYTILSDGATKAEYDSLLKNGLYTHLSPHLSPSLSPYSLVSHLPTSSHSYYFPSPHTLAHTLSLKGIPWHEQYYGRYAHFYGAPDHDIRYVVLNLVILITVLKHLYQWNRHHTYIRYAKVHTPRILNQQFFFFSLTKWCDILSYFPLSFPDDSTIQTRSEDVRREESRTRTASSGS